MIVFFDFFLLSLSLLITDAVPQEIKKLSDYNLKAPTSTVILPDVLMEISGISCIDSTTLACIDDDKGVIFIYDSRKGQITRQINFTAGIDYEGIARVNKTIYILQSTGALFEIPDYLSKSTEARFYETGIPARNNEGLCYDAKRNRLLIACKEGYKDDNLKHKQLIYSFDLKTKKLSKDPVFILDIKLIRKIVKENNIKIPGIDKDDLEKLDFRISDIAINPVTGRLFLISGTDYALIVANINGTIECIEPLKKEFFRQPEGITFNSKGDLYISNEGAGKNPTLVRFNYRKTKSTVTIH